jgi:SAM-dependent methyltransferase
VNDQSDVVRDYWNQLGLINPRWAMDTRGMSDAGDYHWSRHVKQFESAGVNQSSWLHDRWLKHAETSEHKPVVLHVGAGEGRVTVPISRWSEQVLAVDIASSMRRLLARRVSREQVTNVTMLDVMDMHNIPDASVDLVFSWHTLQHNPPAAVEELIKQMCRVTRDTGVLIVQLPARLPHVCDPTLPIMQMHAWCPHDVRKLVSECDWAVTQARPQQHDDWVDMWYTIQHTKHEQMISCDVIYI